MMQWESPNERLAFVHLDFRHDVLFYREQACEITYIDDRGDQATHYPDIDVLTLSGHELWEIKPLRFAERHPVKRRTELLSAELALLGITYRMVYAEELRRAPRLQTLEGILDFSRREVTTAELAMISKEALQKGPLKWGEAKRGAYGPYGREILCRLVLEGRLMVDENARLADQSKFAMRSLEV